MARRKKTSTIEDAMELVSMVPWWAGVGLAIVSYRAAKARDRRLHRHRLHRFQQPCSPADGALRHVGDQVPSLFSLPCRHGSASEVNDGKGRTARRLQRSSKGSA
jgi:hypothetical protein